MLIRTSFQVLPERALIVQREIAEGSEPGPRFYIMVVVSTMIAGFGLVMSSTSVIIGAMLVAPLMTPIFGMALALIRSDAQLLGRAARAEVAGVVAAIFMGFALGQLYPALEPTPEMLSRTRPQLFDLLVAVFSGFAGAYALVDEKISPALPGVAIATAIVPPLANTGLCFAAGAYSGGVGSFLLFFSNFLSILLVASLVFWFFGMAGVRSDLDRQTVIRRFALPIAGFLIIASILTHTLFQISKARHTKSTIEKVLTEELSNLASTIFDQMVYMEDEDNDKIHVFAEAHSGKVITPIQVSQVQKRLAEALGRSTELTLQSKMAYTVAALDSLSQVSKTDLDGRFIKKTPHPRVTMTKVADSTIRNFMADKPATVLVNVQLLQRKKYNILLATVGGIAAPNEETIRQLEATLRAKLEDPELRLIVRFVKFDLFDSEGRLRFELTGFADFNPAQQALVDKAKAIFERQMQSDPDFSLDGFNCTLIDGKLHFFLEVNGNQVFPVDRVLQFELTVAAEIGQPVRVNAVSNISTVATSSGYQSYNRLFQEVFEGIKPKLQKDMAEIVQNSNL